MRVILLRYSFFTVFRSFQVVTDMRKRHSLEDFCDRMSEQLEVNDVIPSELYKTYDVKRGLRNANGTGVLVGLTTVSNVEGYKLLPDGTKMPSEGRLLYRGYDVRDIVGACLDENRFGFDEVTYLLLFGHLPSAKQLEEFTLLLNSKRILPEGFAKTMIMPAPSINIMNKLSRSVLALYSYDQRPDDISISNVLRQSLDIIGYFPSLISYSFKAKRSLFNDTEFVHHRPIPTLSTAENILHMTRASGEFDDIEAKVLDICLMLHAEHGGGNNSTFTTHLISSSGTDTYGVISAAISSLKGPLHGGANIAVCHMIDDLRDHVGDIGNEAQLREYFLKVLRGEANDGSGRVYGLGHAIYTLSDPRAVLLKGIARKLAQSKAMEDDYMLCEYIENKVPEIISDYTGDYETTMPANVDLYSGFIYRALGIPDDISTPLFALSRLSGWCAHRLEELITGKRLMRPAYFGIKGSTKYIPLDERK